MSDCLASSGFSMNHLDAAARLSRERALLIAEPAYGYLREEQTGKRDHKSPENGHEALLAFMNWLLGLAAKVHTSLTRPATK